VAWQTKTGFAKETKPGIRLPSLAVFITRPQAGSKSAQPPQYSAARRPRQSPASTGRSAHARGRAWRPLQGALARGGQEAANLRAGDGPEAGAKKRGLARKDAKKQQSISLRLTRIQANRLPGALVPHNPSGVRKRTHVTVR
jgi:hypothetical protein